MLPKDNFILRYYRKNVYGNELFYLVDNADPIAVLTGCQTLRPRDFKALSELGFRFEEVIAPGKKEVSYV